MGVDAGAGAGRVVVGVSTLEGCRAAVEWAADAADRSAADLEIVRAVQFPPAVDVWTAGYAPHVLDQLDVAARDDLARARDLVRGRLHGDVRTSLVHDHPRPALLRAALGADLLVTGARWHHRLRTGVFGGFQLGSTSLFAASHAPCPVVVVRGPGSAGARDLVVGFDGSPSSRSAARWAVAHAGATGAAVRVLLVWHPLPDVTLGTDLSAVGYRQDHERDEQEARTRLLELCEELREESQRTGPRVDVTGTAVRGDHPQDVLLAAAGDCALLVVGSRGHSAFTSALVGSTSHAVLHRATTPVVVVPDADQAAQRRAACLRAEARDTVH